MTVRIIAIANQKGGVGKTTTTTTLGHGLALRGMRTLIVDFDPQGQCATALGLNPEPGVFNLLITPSRASSSLHQWVRETGRENLHLIPGDRSTATAQIVINAENRDISAVWTALAPLTGEYDYVLFDTAPSAGGLQERAIWASKYVIIPTATEYLSTDGLGQMAQSLADLASRRGWKGELLGVLPTFYDTVTKQSRLAMQSLEETFGKQRKLLPSVRRSTILRECAAEGVTLWEKVSAGDVSNDYTKLIEIVAGK